MHLHNMPDFRRRNFNSVICLLVFLATCGTAMAQDRSTGGPTPSPPGAEVYFVDVKDGQHLPEKAVIHFGLRNMGVAPAGSDQQNSGHHHLLIDTDLPPLDKRIPNDFNHLHFGAGQTETELNLSPGEHTLQLLLGDKDHIPHTPPVISQRIRIIVDAPPTVAASSESAASTFKRKPSPAGARVYFLGLSDGSVLSPNPLLHFGLAGMGVAPAGIDKPNTGHHHLLIDASPLDMNRPIPNDFNHLHFGAGQTEAKVTLPLGWHALQLVLGDENHMPFDPPVMSESVKVLVTATGKKPARHRPPRSSKR